LVKQPLPLNLINRQRKEYLASYENGILTVKEVVEHNGHLYTETSTLTKVSQ